MKSDRRNELQIDPRKDDTSDVADWFRQYWPRLALGAVLALLVAILIYQRISSASQRSAAAQANLAMARYSIQQLEQFNPMRATDPEQAATLREQFADTARSALGAAQQNGKTPAILSEVSITRGDLNWTLANLPPLAEAATRPTLNLPQTSKDYLEQASNAYKQVLEQYSDQTMAVAAAHFGLAAIAENNEDWDTAAKQYEQIKQMKGIPQAYVDQATVQLGHLDQLKQPVYLAPPATLPSPATQPAAAAPTTAPNVPTTAPKASPLASPAASTRPTTRP